MGVGTDAEFPRRQVNSRITGFRDLDPSERLKKLAEITGLSQSDTDALRGGGVLPLPLANGMIENVVGTFELPIGVATNFTINDRDYLIPMAVEEPSVVAAASFMAKLARDNGGFRTSSTEPVMIAQVQILGVRDPNGVRQRILEHRDEIVAAANEQDRVLIELGGGCRDIEVNVFETSPVGPMVVMHLLVDVRDAMGANTVNTMAEAVAPMIEAVTGGGSASHSVEPSGSAVGSRASGTDFRVLATKEYSGDRIAQGIVEACAMAIVDPYRAATHNKGIMNGIDPVVVATGNDWRAIEAGAHAWAARDGRYTSLTRWEVRGNDTLVGSIEMPMALGLVGGATRTHPAAQASLALLGVKSAQELSEITVAVGLAQNMAALRALASEGIQRGHMTLHARNIAIVAGATGNQIEIVAGELAESHDVRVDRAKEILRRLTGQ